jgi:glutaconate CoA-transferase subunit A
VPQGAFPSYAQGYYSRDNRFYKTWDSISRTRESFQAWIDQYVHGVAGFDEFLDLIGARASEEAHQ